MTEKNESAVNLGRLSHLRHKERDEKGYRERQSLNGKKRWINRETKNQVKVLENSQLG